MNDAVVSHNIFAFWTADNPMNGNRRRGWESFRVTGLNPILVTPVNLSDWIVTGAPLHPAYPHLSAVHRSDYLRPYFMHHHGGGYADVKPQGGSWLETVDRVKASSRLLGAGYREVRGGSVWLQNAPLDGRYWVLSRPVPRLVATTVTNIMRAARPLLIGNGAFYFKPKTALTLTWLTEVERRLDLVLDSLKLVTNPAPRARLTDGSGYPLPWSAIHGDVLQPLTLRYAARLDRSVPRPMFRDYD